MAPHLPFAPSLFAPILDHSRVTPGATAVVASTGSLTYREFVLHIERVTRQVHHLGIPPGARVAVLAADAYLNRLITLALARTGHLSVTAKSENFATIAPHTVISDRPRDLPGFNTKRASRQWFDAASDALPPFEEQPHPWEAPARIVMSSGTTGTPKMALFTYGQLYERNRACIVFYQFTRATRFVTTMGMISVGGFLLPYSAWAAGGSVGLVQAKDGDPTASYLRLAPNTMFVSTAQLESMLYALPADHLPMAGLKIYVAGSALPRAVNRHARMRLTPDLFMVYGSTEIGSAAIAHASFADAQPRFTGFVMSPAEVQIVDEQGLPVAPGTPGEVRIRNEGQAGLYLDDPETTARTFRDGWVHPGDLGSVSAAGELFILGRVTEVMNFGGNKVSPDSMEDALAGTPGATELAAFAASTPERDTPCVAVVAAPDFDEAELRKRYRKAFPRLPDLTVFRVASIPRNDMGKVLRGELASALAAHPPRTAASSKLH